VTSLNRKTGRDRYFAARERELEELLNHETGMVSERYAREIPCPSCGSEDYERLFVKRGFPIVRCHGCRLVYANPQVDERVVVDRYRAGGSNDLWVDVLTSERQLALDRAKFSDILDELEPYRGEGRLLDVGCSIGFFLHLAREQGWSGRGTEFGERALTYAHEQFGVEAVDRPIDELEGDYDVVTVLSVLEHVNQPRAFLRQIRRLLRANGATYLIVPNVESLACRVLHERAATFDGWNHLVYFSPSTLASLLDREGFDVVRLHTRVSSFDPVLEWLAYREPYTDADLGDDSLVAALSASREQIERLLDEHLLGYKLHCLARKREDVGDGAVTTSER